MVLGHQGVPLAPFLGQEVQSDARGEHVVHFRLRVLEEGKFAVELELFIL